MTRGKLETRAELLARMDERLRNMDNKLEGVRTDVKDLRTQVGDLSTWQAGIKGSWKTVILVSGLLAFVVSLVVALISG